MTRPCRSAGMARNRPSSASMPPAEAPTPTMGKGASTAALGFREGGANCWVARLSRSLRQAGPELKAFR